jgi:hypothetical protein
LRYPPNVVGTELPLIVADAVRKRSRKVHAGTVDTDVIVAFDRVD